jgi:hypothetical protein
MRIQWPGYEHVGWKVNLPIYSQNGMLITRRELAGMIAQQFRDFTSVGGDYLLRSCSFADAYLAMQHRPSHTKHGGTLAPRS